MPRPTTIGARLEYARVQSGLSVGQAARILERSGFRVTPDRLREFETEEAESILRAMADLWRTETIAALSELYDVSTAWIQGEASEVPLPISIELKASRLPDGDRDRLATLLDMLAHPCDVAVR